MAQHKNAFSGSYFLCKRHGGNSARVVPLTAVKKVPGNEAVLSECSIRLLSQIFPKPCLHSFLAIKNDLSGCQDNGKTDCHSTLHQNTSSKPLLSLSISLLE